MIKVYTSITVIFILTIAAVVAGCWMLIHSRRHP
jgi:hypothetical protein